jgi:hypothetical protein
MPTILYFWVLNSSLSNHSMKIIKHIKIKQLGKKMYTLLLSMVFCAVSTMLLLGNKVFAEIAFFPASPPVTSPVSDTPMPTNEPTLTQIPASITPSPTIPSQIVGNRVFVTSLSYDGNLGGVTGADAKCQERANSANLGGIWKAWITTATTIDVANSFVHSNNPYKLLDGTLIANNWTDLTDQTLLHSINMTEYREVVDRVQNYWNVWTNTGTSGHIYDTQTDLTCANWTSNLAARTGRGGSTAETNYRWTASEYTGHQCNTQARLYCFEQISELTPTHTPTPTNKIMPSSTPTVTLVPTLPVTAPISVIPSPTLIQNAKPVISTFFLPLGRINKQYNAIIEGYDANKDDVLKLEVNNLPKGINLGSCMQKIKNNKKTIECDIKGKPSKIGIYLVKANISDNKGASANKEIPLLITW